MSSHITAASNGPGLDAAPSQPFPLGLSSDSSTSPDSVNAAFWAPGVENLALVREVDGSPVATELTRDHDGVHHGIVDRLPVGGRYWLVDKDNLTDNDTAQQVPLLDPWARGVEMVDGRWTAVRLADAATDAHPETPAPLRTPWRDTIIYEAHVKGMTAAHPDIPKHLRGTYAGLAHPVMVGYLRELGITAVELLPIHLHADEPHLGPLGLTNYWGYNTLGFFAPHPEYATEQAQAAGAQAVSDEFRNMVAALHDAGLEVLLDVVYNHTAEGGPGEPALSWRGLGEKEWYRHRADGTYEDTTGCGNSLDFSQPRVVQFALDSLRHWVTEYGVDGFRFDLAPTLARDENNEFTPSHPFLVAISADPVLAPSKLIAEPWDIGMGGWQTGNFPPGWADWNDRFRDTVRAFWLEDQAALDGGAKPGTLAALGDALAGSLALFEPSGRSALASINFVTAHDGFTLADLTAYNHKHNEANGEHNRDGADHSRSWNHGHEGVADDDKINAARERTRFNLMATLLFSLGVPMITAGDELARSQRGNNNAYCQDNEIAWLNWDLDESARRMLVMTRQLIRRRRQFLNHQGQTELSPGQGADLDWFAANGKPMDEAAWNDPSVRTVQMAICCDDGALDALIVVNGSAHDVEVRLPVSPCRRAGLDSGNSTDYTLVCTTALEAENEIGARYPSGTGITAPAWSITAFHRD